MTGIVYPQQATSKSICVHSYRFGGASAADCPYISPPTSWKTEVLQKDSLIGRAIARASA